MDFSIFSDEQLSVAETNISREFDGLAKQGLFNQAAGTHQTLSSVRAELERRAIAGLRKSEAA